VALAQLSCSPVGLKCAARGLLNIQDAKICHLGTIAKLCRAISSQLRHASTVGKKSLNSNISSTCSHNMANFDSLTAEISWRVWGIPTNFNGFRVLASLLQRRHSTEVNQTLHDVWPYQRLLHWCSCSSYLSDSEGSVVSLIKHPAVKTEFVYYNTTLRSSAPRLKDFWPISVSAKWLHGSRCHLVWR